MDQEARERFELELKWCIEELQSTLSTRKLTTKQAEDANRTLKILQSTKAPLPKKRQTMSVHFKNYRAKMKEEEEKIRKANMDICFKKITPNEKSVFFRKCASKQNNKYSEATDSSSEHEIVKLNTSGNAFKFGFHSESENTN